MHYDATLKNIFQTLPQRLLLLLAGQEATDLLPVEFSSVKRRQPDLFQFQIEMATRRQLSERRDIYGPTP
ncbi:MAG: hypothetical protein HQL66_13240 [Magnetococcales bacterium]|nr:hypothetical protein [Magnetococcales bacterium]